MNARYDAWVKRVEFIGLDQLMKPSVDCHSTLFNVILLRKLTFVCPCSSSI